MSKYYLVDKAMNVVAEGNSFDRLQSRADAEFDSLYVIDESDFLVAMGEEPIEFTLPFSMTEDEEIS